MLPALWRFLFHLSRASESIFSRCGARRAILAGGARPQFYGRIENMSQTACGLLCCAGLHLMAPVGPWNARSGKEYFIVFWWLEVKVVESLTTHSFKSDRPVPDPAYAFVRGTALPYNRRKSDQARPPTPIPRTTVISSRRA